MLVSWAIKTTRRLLGKEKPEKPTACGHGPEPTVDCPECGAERRRATRYRWTIFAGLLLPCAIQSLDTTIIATALPTIAIEFDELEEQNWIVSSFNLTFAAFIPFWGTICDIFGRHTTLQANMVIILVGSALCTGSPTSAFPVLLLGRALQGVACAGLDVVTRVILADKVSLRESNENWTMFSFIDGIAFGVGPVIGGYLTQTDWRWCFGINLPLAVAAILVIFLLLRKELLGPQPIPRIDSTPTITHHTLTHRLKTIDWPGQLLFLLGLALLVLSLTWAGATHPWSSPAVLVPLCAGVALVVAWVFWEYMMLEDGVLGKRWPWRTPMVEWGVLSDRNIGLTVYTSFVTGAAMFAIFYFCSIYFVFVAGDDPSDAGIGLLFFTPGVAVGLYLAFTLVNTWPRNTYAPLLIGSVLQAVGMGMLAWALYTERKPVIYGMMALAGAGSGFRLLCMTIHAIGMFPDQVATVVSLVAVASPLGGTIGHTMMSTVFNNVVGLGSADGLMSDVGSFGDLPAGELADVTHSIKMGVVWAYVALVPFMVVGVIASFFLGAVILPEGKGSEEDRRANIIVREPYLLALLRGRTYRSLGDQLKGNELQKVGVSDGDAGGNGRDARLAPEVV